MVLGDGNTARSLRFGTVDFVPPFAQAPYGRAGAAQRHHVPERREDFVKAVRDHQVTGPRIAVLDPVDDPIGKADGLQQDGHVDAAAGQKVKRPEPRGGRDHVNGQHDVPVPFRHSLESLEDAERLAVRIGRRRRRRLRLRLWRRSPGGVRRATPGFAVVVTGTDGPFGPMGTGRGARRTREKRPARPERGVVSRADQRDQAAAAAPRQHRG